MRYSLTPQENGFIMAYMSLLQVFAQGVLIGPLNRYFSYVTKAANSSVVGERDLTCESTVIASSSDGAACATAWRRCY